MKRSVLLRGISLCLIAFILSVFMSFAQVPIATAQAPPSSAPEAPTQVTALSAAEVGLGGEKLFDIKASVGAFSPQD
ncbi:MAG: hypothetical protein AAFY72_01290, partial [Cyanobacteria bacterium J06649_4]